jgi:hypothetical protein
MLRGPANDQRGMSEKKKKELTSLQKRQQLGTIQKSQGSWSLFFDMVDVFKPEIMPS